VLPPRYNRQAIKSFAPVGTAADSLKKDPANGARTPIVVQAVDTRSSASARNLICSRSASVTLMLLPQSPDCIQPQPEGEGKNSHFQTSGLQIGAGLWYKIDHPVTCCGRGG
jgi:hypothetical protein